MLDKCFPLYLCCSINPFSNPTLLLLQGIYAPSRQALREVNNYEMRVTNLTTNLYKDFNTSLYQYRAGAEAGALPTLSAAQFSQLNASIAKANSAAKALTDLKKRQTGELTPFSCEFVLSPGTVVLKDEAAM
jgi:hypothetical protein